MPISDRDLKILWARAAGICCFPGCEQSCIVTLQTETTPVIGEMAHIIARKPDGPRGLAGQRGADGYDNLVLLCPTHHTLVDKAPEEFPPDLLKSWKREHETRVERAILAVPANSKADLCADISAALASNRSIWELYGPESAAALSNPLSRMADVWKASRWSKIIPNNRRIFLLLQRGRSYFNTKEWIICQEFISHAECFEQNSVERLEPEAYLKFPVAFAELIENAASAQ